MKTLMSVAGWVIPDWANFFIMAGAFLVVAAGTLVWILYFHKHKRRRRKHRHHHHSRQPNISIAQKGGLPPARREERPSGLSSSTPRS